MEYFALLIPIVAIVVALFLYTKRFTWWELLFPLVVSLLVIVVCKAVVKTTVVSDTEYWGSMVVKARYYEYWETWVSQTCTRTYSCNCDSKGNCQTCIETYDCSYCDENPARWYAYDDTGNVWEISQEYYLFLIKKWGVSPQFVELERDIDNHGSCGQDGDMYEIRWPGAIETSEAAVTQHTYVNKVQASHSAFNLPHITKKQAKEDGLYKYPPFYDYYKQKVVLGLDSICSYDDVQKVEEYFQYFNGHYGTINKVKLFLCLFYNRPYSIGAEQEAFWDGGNQNELVICIGLDKASKQIQWVYPFSWTDNKRILIDCREDISNLKKFTPIAVWYTIVGAVGKNDVHKSFKKDFDYLTVDMPDWSMWLIWILTLFTSAGLFIWGYGNDIEGSVGEFDIYDWFSTIYKNFLNLFR